MNQKQRLYQQTENETGENTEETGRFAWTAKVNSPCSIASCGAAIVVALLCSFSMGRAVLSAGAVSVSGAAAGLAAMPVAIAGLWIGILGKYDRKEKRQNTSFVGCVANGVLFVVLAGIYITGLIH